MYCDQDEDSKMYAVSSPRKKSRGSSPRSGVGANDNANRDEYDVLGRKKPKTPRTPMSWDPKDDILLKQLKEEQRLGWKEIATHFRGRTSHACQFRWRRLASGQLKYYQGHRRPPPVTTTAASFANEMASTATAGSIQTSPKILMNGLHSVSPTNTTPRQHHVVPHLSPTTESSLPSMHPSLYQPSPQATWGNASLYQPTPLPSPNSYAPRFLGEDHIGRDNWSEQEDALLLNRKLSFDEVNVLLAGRSEQEIFQRQVKLRQNQMNPRPHSGYDERMPVLGSVYR
ncbi:hypothetical protein EDC01DRAFT_775468 [Geopyxis carbonaria]|nr:hypothetical protein EDC01DRAFT_775468 [Geopyxis carbonaria]